MQLQMEEEQIIRDRAANATALAALGNRRKRALEGEVRNQTTCFCAVLPGVLNITYRHPRANLLLV